MSRTFLSHSAHDNAAACALRDWLAGKGWDDVFLDLDPRRGLITGERWQEALTRAANRCEAVVFVISPDWAASKWCLAEFLLAKSLGKRVFGVIVRATDLTELPREMVGEFQVADLSVAGDQAVLAVSPPGSRAPAAVRFSRQGLGGLRRGLEQAGLDPRTFPLNLKRPRYPGLQALATEDAAIFFGRDADIVRSMDLIRQMRRGGKRAALERWPRVDAQLLLYTNHMVGAEEFPFGPRDGVVGLPARATTSTAPMPACAWRADAGNYRGYATSS